MIAPITCRFRVQAVEPLTHDITLVRLESDEPFPFLAGQYASVTFPRCPPRDYSIASLPGDPLLELHIRRTQGGSTSLYVATELTPGDPVTVTGPLGECYLREEHPGPILGIAGGSGLAPIRSILETALIRGMRRQVRLYYGGRDERDIYMERHFDGLAKTYPNFRFVPVLSEPTSPTTRRTGLVHEAVLADLPDLAGWAGYLAGPPAMVEAAAPALERHGLAPDDIHADAFYDDHIMRARRRERHASTTAQDQRP